MLKPATNFSFKALEAIWLTLSDTSEPRFWILGDYDGTITIDYSTAVAAVAFFILLVVTPPDTVLAIVDP